LMAVFHSIAVILPTMASCQSQHFLLPLIPHWQWSGPLKLWNLPRRKKYHDLQVVRCSICHSTPLKKAPGSGKRKLIICTMWGPHDI
jgi:hypothetical protein